MKLTPITFKDECEFLATIRKPLLALRLLDCCVSSVKKYRLGTSKCNDHDIFTFNSQSDCSILREVTRKPILSCSFMITFPKV